MPADDSMIWAISRPFAGSPVREALSRSRSNSAPLVVRVEDLREVVLKPGDKVQRWGVEWRTNEQGMRDRSYATDKPAGTFRIAFVGDSIGVGWGVDVDQRFESILERDWDARSRGSGGPAIEILNCAVPGHSPGQRWYHFSQVGWPMRPDLVIYELNRGR